MNHAISFPVPVSASWNLAAACLAVLAVVPAVRAQGGLGVEDVIAAVLKENPEVRTARAGIDAERGAVMEAARPFDMKPEAAVTASRTERQDGSGSQPAASYSTLFPEANLSLSKMFRSGTSVSSRVLLSRSPLNPLDPGRLSQVTFTTGLTVPLAQGRGGGIYSAVERAAALDLSVSRSLLRATASAAVLGATTAYWEYRAAYERAAIQRAAATRARRTVEEVKILIAADERPQSDIDLMMANAATKHAGELEADRQIVQARHVLALAIGLDLDAAAALETPSTPLPDPGGTERLPLDLLIADALARHHEVDLVTARVESARELRDGAARQLNPRFDFVVAGSYSGHVAGSGLSVSEPLSGSPAGSSVAMQFVFEPSTGNSSLRAAVLMADAVLAQASVAADKVARTIRINIADALAALESSRAQVTSTRDAVGRSRLALETVQRNFELGSATLFDRILAEDTVTNAELADLAANLRYARALVNLQFARGVLVGGDGAELVADPRHVLLASREDIR